MSTKSCFVDINPEHVDGIDTLPERVEEFNLYRHVRRRRILPHRLDHCLHDCQRLGADSTGIGDKFNDIQPALAILDLGYKALRAPQTLCDLGLRHAILLARRRQQLPEGQVMVGPGRSAHAEFLTAAAQNDYPDVLLAALSHAAKAKGMTQVAKDAGLGRESLYKALSPGAHPRFETISAVLRALNVRMAIVAG